MNASSVSDYEALMTDETPSEAMRRISTRTPKDARAAMMSPKSTAASDRRKKAKQDLLKANGFK